MSERPDEGEPQHPTRAAGAFYGRRKGQPLKPAQAQALDHLERLRVPERIDDPLAMFDVSVERLRIEIGFGGGEHLLHRAREAPTTGFVGVEPFINGMAKLLRAWDAERLPNIRLHDEDAGVLLDRFPDGSVDHVDLLYPDPWRKVRHHKRRFVGPTNLDRLARVLRSGGTFHFASDWPDYVNWTLAHLAAYPEFTWEALGPNDWQRPFEGWPGTRYESKAIREGREPTYLRFRRR